jgi:predicted phosphoadenosine phosphosulfate sulfurtransferase
MNIVDRTKREISRHFNNWSSIAVAISGGKDSSVLYDLFIREAEVRNRKIFCVFVDQEAEYQETIRVISNMMNHPLVIPIWIQTPMKMTAAGSFDSDFLYA